VANLSADLSADLDADLSLSVRLDSALREAAHEIRQLAVLLQPRPRYQYALSLKVDDQVTPRPIKLADGRWSLRRLVLATLPGFSGSSADVTIDHLLPWPLLVRVSTGSPVVLLIDLSVPRDIAPAIAAASVSGSAGAVGVLMHFERE
jgi:hypothetical protein